jgi:hypothetical protein
MVVVVMEVVEVAAETSEPSHADSLDITRVTLAVKL